jgi:hypothetical protein
MHREKGMGSKAAVVACLLVGLVSTGQVVAQTAGGSSTKTSDSQTALPSSVHQPLNLQLTSDVAVSNVGDWKDQRGMATQPNQFARMFQEQAKNGDPRRVPMYLLVPFAKVAPSSDAPIFAAHPVNATVLPNVVKDVGALIRTIQSGG